MVIRNKKLIGLILGIAGVGIVVIWGNILVKIISLPITGITAQAKVIGYKTSRGYGARMVSTATSLKHFASGKSPYFAFLSSKGDTVKSYSNAPQVFILFNYSIGDEITVAYPQNEAQKAVIVNWREFPGILFMLAFGFLMLLVGKDYLFKKA